MQKKELPLHHHFEEETPWQHGASAEENFNLELKMVAMTGKCRGFFHTIRVLIKPLECRL